MKLATNNVVLIARHTQKAILLGFVKFLKNFDIFFFIKEYEVLEINRMIFLKKNYR